MLSLLPTDTHKVRPRRAPEALRLLSWLRDQWPWITFLGKRLLSAAVTFVIITVVLYAMTLLTPVDDRARPYLSPRMQFSPAQDIRIFLDQAIENYGLDDPFPVQYWRWLSNIVQGEWGFSPVLRSDVLPAITSRSAATVELTLSALLIYIPVGLAVGTLAAWRQGRIFDRTAQIVSYTIIAIPPFVLGLALIAIVYVQLGLFALSRIGYAETAMIREIGYWQATGLLTIDGLLNFRPNISWQAIRHLVLPSITLAALHMAATFQITRATVREELQKEYVLLARGMGLRTQSIVFGYALKNALLPALTHAGVAAAQLVTGVFVVEVVFNWHGVSELLTYSVGPTPDVNLALGFAVYSVIVVLTITFILEIIQGLVDPRVRQGSELK